MEQITPSILRIVAVDPGNNMGLSFLEFDRDTMRVKCVDSHTVVIDRHIEVYWSELLATHGTLLARTYAIGKIVGKYCDGWTPDFLVHETAFSAHGRRGFGNSVESFASLRENILAIKLATMSANTSIRIIPINPQTVKYAVAGKQSNDKDDISNALRKLPDLDIECDTEFLDQHSWDSMAIGYTFVKKNILGVPKNEHSKRNKRTKGNKAKRSR